MSGIQDDCSYLEQQSENYQVFKNEDIKCHILHVLVEKGNDISKGWLGNLFDTPDPYLVFWVPKTPNGRKRTRVIKNDANPEWNEELTFVVNPERDFELRAMLVDKGTAVDQVLGKVRIDFSDLPLDTEVKEVLSFKHGSSVTVKFLKVDDGVKGPELMFGPSLSEAELTFLERRRAHVFRAMQSLLGAEDGPRDHSQVPRIAVVGSGGGLRAFAGLSAALTALHDMGVLDCVTYIASLSGSSWYVSDLYTQPDFPEKGPGEFQQEVRDKLTGGWLKVFCPAKLVSHLKQLSKKRKAGQPVSFTDLFGHLIGDLILGSRKDLTLSSQRSKVMSGQAPLPLYTCVQIKKDVSARVYQDWVEFSPLQVGFLKHAAYMAPQQFGDSFYLGRAVRRFGESPLHYLQGVWGSAFSIFLRRVIEKSRADALSPSDDAAMRDMMRGAEERASTSSDSCGEDDVSSSCSQDSQDDGCVESVPPPQELLSVEKIDNGSTSSVRRSKKKLRRSLRTRIRYRITRRLARRKTRRPASESILRKLLRVQVLDTRAGRAGVIFSPIRGVQFAASEPRTPAPFTTADDDKDFKGFYEPVCPHVKKLFVADSGLSFNLPYPPLLRAQRDVSLYISFEFSSRSKDDASPFEELMLAENWARLHRVRFPPVAELVRRLRPGPLQECYVFEHPRDPLCPVVLHFVLVNNTFRSHKDVGVLRQTQEEKDFADFDIFSDPDNPYSSFKFSYEPLQLDRLVSLVDFNTRLHEPLIKDKMARAVRCTRQQPSAP